MVFIYALKLTGNKFYIGKTEDPQFRLETHFSQKGGSAWTKKYSPIQIHEIIPNQSDYDEQRVTQEYMNKYGIDNVRGGPWCNINLTNGERGMIQKILNSSSDKCYKCGEQGHFAKFCPSKDAKNVSLVNSKKKVKNCNRCGRYGHNELQCYAKIDIDGDIIEGDEEYWECSYCGKEFDSEKGCRFHENVHCKMKNKQKSNSSCKRCGRLGHLKNNCYAETHYKGYNLY